MAVVKETTIHRYVGLAGDTMPTGVPVGSTYLAYDTDALYITYDGTNWVERGMVAGTAAANLGKAEDGAHSSGDTGVMALAVRQDTAAALATTDGDYVPLIVDASGRLHVAPLVAGSALIGKVGIDQVTANANEVVLKAGSALIGKTQPFAAVLEGGLTEIIDKDDTEVSQNDYSKSVSVALGGTYSGEILQICLYATELGSGAVPANSGYLFVFDADPTVSAGDTALALADWQSCIAKVLVSDWSSDANGGMAVINAAIPFHALATLYFVFKNSGTAINDAAGDDEEMHFNVWYRRDS